MTDYAATYPTNMAIDERFKRFISSFYAVSDDASRNEEWVAYFTPLAYVIMGDKRARGEDGKMGSRCVSMECFIAG